MDDFEGVFEKIKDHFISVIYQIKLNHAIYLIKKNILEKISLEVHYFISRIPTTMDKYLNFNLRARCWINQSFWCDNSSFISVCPTCPSRQLSWLPSELGITIQIVYLPWVKKGKGMSHIQPNTVWMNFLLILNRFFLVGWLTIKFISNFPQLLPCLLFFPPDHWLIL